MLATMDVSADSNELAPDEVVSATYYPSKRRLIVSGLAGALFGLVAAVAYAGFTGAEGVQLLVAIAGPAAGAIVALMSSIRTASLKFGTDWVEGPREGGTGSILIRRRNALRLEVIDQRRIRVIRSDFERLMVDLGHYDFMDAQMIRMRLTAIAGGSTSTPPEMLISDSRQRKARGRRRQDQSGSADDSDEFR